MCNNNVRTGNERRCATEYNRRRSGSRPHHAESQKPGSLWPLSPALSTFSAVSLTISATLALPSRSNRAFVPESSPSIGAKLRYRVLRYWHQYTYRSKYNIGLNTTVVLEYISQGECLDTDCHSTWDAHGIDLTPGYSVSRLHRNDLQGLFGASGLCRSSLNLFLQH